jgi:hypothetical protein
MFDSQLLDLESRGKLQGGTYILTKGDNYTKVRKNLIILRKICSHKSLRKMMVETGKP